MTLELLIVVDTEEEFDWSAPFSRDAVATRSIHAQARAHAIYDRLGIVPTYVMGYPVATDPESVRVLKALHDAGKAEIGAHLHPWVTPPHAEEVNRRNSYQSNLPPELERQKIETLTAAIETAFGARPRVFKAGRYGFGPNTAAVLADLGYEVDCSYMPHTSFAADQGPDFRGRPDSPHWLDEERGLLEIPMTVGFLGRLRRFGPKVKGVFDSRQAGKLHIPGTLARTGLVARSRLTPEGTPAGEQMRLIRAMAGAGHSIFTLTYHSPSLEPGHTPYVKNEAELARFLGSIERVLTFFRDEMGGRFTTLTRVRRDFTRDRAAA